MKSSDTPTVIRPGATIRAHALAPDAVPCPSWCTVDWHTDPRLWNSYDLHEAGQGLSGTRTCRGARSSVPMLRELDGGRTEDSEPVQVFAERWQRFDLGELRTGGGPVQVVQMPAVRVVSIHADEDYLYPASLVALVGALQDAHAAITAGATSSSRGTSASATCAPWCANDPGDCGGNCLSEGVTFLGTNTDEHEPDRPAGPNRRAALGVALSRHDGEHSIHLDRNWWAADHMLVVGEGFVDLPVDGMRALRDHLSDLLDVVVGADQPAAG